MKIVIDLDWTICSLRKEWQDYSEVTPNIKAIEKIKILKEKWHYIIIQTARHMETCNSNLWLVNAKVSQKTLNWLDQNEIPYDEIFLWKPNWAIYLDDNAKQFTWWDEINDIENYNEKNINIVIPMAWAWSRFEKSWYNLPKPLIDVKWKTMLEWAVSSFDFLKDDYNLKFIFIVLNKHIKKYNIDTFLKNKYPNSKIIWLDKITRWQTETVYKAKKFINDYNKLIIYNSDTYSTYNLEDFPIHKSNIDWLITCFNSDNERYSYAKLDKYNYVSQVAEKKVISNNATNWLYYFKRWNEFIHFAKKMILNNELSNWEFYVWPLYNWLINIGKRIVIAPIKENWVIWTPEELEYFLKNYK